MISSRSLQLEIRLRAARIIHQANSSHIGGVFSSADILAILFGEILKKDASGFLDSFILSKGHCCAGVYAALNILGFISDEDFDSFGKDGSKLMAHISHKVSHVEFSTGSLGHGLPFAVGKALHAKRSGNLRKQVYTLLSDGELDEGSNWEAILFAGHHRLSNLTVLVDYNKLQSLDSTFATLNLEPLHQKFIAFNWSCFSCNGNNLSDLRHAFAEPGLGKPRVIICDTIKGFPVDFMLNKVIWHYKAPSVDQLVEISSQVMDFYL